jgi:hypothetical protein
LETAYLRRRAFIAHYLARTGRLHRLLRPRFLLPLWIALKRLPLALWLLTVTLFFDAVQWWILAADVVLAYGLIHALRALLNGEVHGALQRPLAHLWSRRVNALLLWLALLLQMFFAPQENYAGFSWLEVVDYAAARVDVHCDALALLARLSSVSEALSLWAAQAVFAEFTSLSGLFMAWILFVASFGVSFLFAWAFSDVLLGVAARPWVVARSFQDAKKDG